DRFTIRAQRTFSIEPTPPLLAAFARPLSGRRLAASSLRSMRSRTAPSCPFRRAIDSNGCMGIARANTAFESTISFASVSAGRVAMPTKLRSQTTTEPHLESVLSLGRRLPRYGPPTPPGEMLLEEVVKPLG